jgi:hypothetical protein
MRTWLAPVALLLAVACGGPEGLAPSARDRLETATDVAEQARDEARAASDLAEELEGQVDDLTADLHRAAKARRQMVGRLALLRERLWASVGIVRDGLGEARSVSGAAAAEADDALARAAEVARDLSVLQQRYDYHLRRYHGGG